MQKTLLVTIDFPPMFGGVANYWANLCQCLPSNDVVVLAPECFNSLDFDLKQNYLVYRKNLFSKISGYGQNGYLCLSILIK